ncbi:MAG TPA: translocation/assembly module TamB domain-containing protein [Bryobacteraceae bacterium]|nr:translocation/assembly module TamB domain-containing protein [Bryobacteraceae bacterium]
MSRGTRIARNAAVAIGGLLVALVVIAFIIVHTVWFRNYVRQTIIVSVEDSTGGRVDVGSFDFDVNDLRATVANFVIHGTEPASAPPFVSIPRVEVDLRLFTSLRRLYEISYIGVEKPAVNIAMQPDGKSNIPTPRKKSTSNESTLETVVDLAVDKFALNNGVLTLFSMKQPLTVRGNNVRAQLVYSLAKDAYDGTFAIEPLYLLNGRNTPVNFMVTLPVTLTKDRIDLHHATITTPLSQISADGSIANMKSPGISAHIQGRIAGADLVHAANLPLATNTKESMPDLTLDASAVADQQSIKVTALHVNFGQSNLEASGTLKDPRGEGSLQLRADLGLRQIGRLAKLISQPDGTIAINAIAKLDAANRFQARGNVEGSNLAFIQGKQQFSNIRLVTSFDADSRNLNLNGLRVNAFGGEFAGNASLADFERYKLDGELHGFDIQTALRTLGVKLPYDGGLSGSIHAQGDTKAPGTKSVMANAHLSITPGRRGIPVSGRLNANYNGAADDVLVENSYLALPHTRLDLSGSLEKRLTLSLTSKDLHDLSAPIALVNNGEADFNGAVTGGISNPRLTGHVAVGTFAIDGRQFDSFAADVSASNSAATVSNAALVRGMMHAAAEASLALRNWSPTPRSPVRVKANMNDADLADVMVLAGQNGADYSGALSATINVNGTYGDPIGTASIQASKGTIEGEPFNSIQIQANLTDQLASVPAAYIDAPAGRVDLNAEFRHPRDSFKTGQVHAHVRSAELNLSRSDLSGRVAIDADVTGSLQEAEPVFMLTAVNGNVSTKALRVRGVSYGDLTASAQTARQNIVYKVSSDFAGSNIEATGNTQLATDYPTTADVRIAALPVERVLAVANESTIPAKGNLSGSIHFHGTASVPQGEAQLDLSKGVVYGETIDQARVRMSYLPGSIDVPQLEVVSGPSRIDATAHFDHPAGNFRNGQARFTLAGNRLNLARSATVQRFRPGLGGMVDVNADAAASIRNSTPAIMLTAVSANIMATGLAAEGKQLGDLKLTANTDAGHRVTFALDSNIAGATIQGSGNATLNAQYPIDAHLSIRNAAWTRIEDLIGRKSPGPERFEATSDGDVAIRGPLLDSKQLSGSIQLAKLNVTTIPQGRAEKPVAFANQGPIQVALDRGLVRIQNAHLTGPNTDIQASGTASLTGSNLNLNLRANADLSVARNFDSDIYSGGSIAFAATVRGDLPKPLINGQLTLQNATFSTPSIPLGISNANGTIVLNGNSAQIRTLTAESGGGRINVTGFASFAETAQFSLRATADQVRVRVQQGVSITADANIRLSGNADQSRITGTATVDRISYAPQSDFGSILTRSAPPVQSPTAPSSLLSNMKLEVRVRSVPGMTVQSSLSEDLQADADLRIRGSVQQPSVQGRVSITSGKLLFFGTNYTVNTGTVSFFDPFRVEPVLDFSLETQAQGVKVTVRVTGPIENMKLSYTSDPPLQFQEIVSLLAAGTTPTSDPTLLANQPAQPQQGFQQMGESAILGQAVANPVANQLQRVFGVTQLKIDPSFTTGSAVPTARLALQQRITNNLTFTYVSAIDQPNSTIIRMEWAFSPTWSAVATRDEFGLFSVNFFYKRAFR